MSRNRGLLALGTAMAAILQAKLDRMSPDFKYQGMGYNVNQKTNHTRERGKYMPHQGERECARRRAQMAKAHGKSPVARFYGQLSGGE